MFILLLSKVTVLSLTYDDLLQVMLTYSTVRIPPIFLSLFLSEMSTVSRNDLNLKLWNGATDGDNNAVLAAMAAGGDVNWKNNSQVSDNDI